MGEHDQILPSKYPNQFFFVNDLILGASIYGCNSQVNIGSEFIVTPPHPPLTPTP